MTDDRKVPQDGVPSLKKVVHHDAADYTKYDPKPEHDSLSLIQCLTTTTESRPAVPPAPSPG